ncbi:hypothetical protein SRHO_G00170030 [Serrasalmus rhombeus]
MFARLAAGHTYRGADALLTSSRASAAGPWVSGWPFREACSHGLGPVVAKCVCLEAQAWPCLSPRRLESRASVQLHARELSHLRDTLMWNAELSPAGRPSSGLACQPLDQSHKSKATSCL